MSEIAPDVLEALRAGTIGRATCANCATCWSARSFWRAKAPSRCKHLPAFLQGRAAMAAAAGAGAAAGYAGRRRPVRFSIGHHRGGGRKGPDSAHSGAHAQQQNPRCRDSGDQPEDPAQQAEGVRRRKKRLGSDARSRTRHLLTCPCADCCGWRRAPVPDGPRRPACRRCCAGGFSPSAR